jgi:hypothetical protein
VCHVHLNERGLIDLTDNDFVLLKKRVKQWPKRLVPQFDVMHLLIKISCDQYKPVQTSKQLKMINFDDKRLSQADYMALTGLKKTDFDTVVHEMNNMRQSQRWSRRNSVGVYLTRLKTGMNAIY